MHTLELRNTFPIHTRFNPRTTSIYLSRLFRLTYLSTSLATHRPSIYTRSKLISTTPPNIHNPPSQVTPRSRCSNMCTFFQINARLSSIWYCSGDKSDRNYPSPHDLTFAKNSPKIVSNMPQSNLFLYIRCTCYAYIFSIDHSIKPRKYYMETLSILCVHKM